MNIFRTIPSARGACFAVLLALTTAAFAAAPDAAKSVLAQRPTPPTRGWVNVRDYRASGSTFETKGDIEAGSKRLSVAKVGDFKPGQGIVVYGARTRFEDARVYDPGQMYRSKPIKDQVELRGFDGKQTFWRTFVLDIDGEKPATFRWSKDIANTWTVKVAVTGDWQTLSDGVAVRFKTKAWRKGTLITFHARNDLITEIVAVEGNVLVLKDAAATAAKAARVRHHDSAAIQRALKAALAQQRNLFIPSGHYRLDRGFTVGTDQSIWIEGENPAHTVLDISEGKGPVIRLSKTKDVTLRNMRMVGHTGLGDIPLNFRRADRSSFWTMNLRSCNAVSINGGAARTWIENVHASRMSSECFYAQGPMRRGLKPDPKYYQRSLTYFRCTVTDVLFNAFNNNDFGDNTNILYCLVNGASNFWEGPARFVRCIGNHVRNCHNYGTFGNTRHRVESFNHLGAGQTVIADNVFEGLEKGDGERASRAGRGPTVVGPANEVIITNNTFVNFSSGTALRIGLHPDPGYPTGHVTVSGNMIDLTAEPDRIANLRAGILVATSDVVLSNNQIYVRGDADPNVTGIQIEGAAINVSVHDNIIRNCYYGLLSSRASTSVTEVLAADAFKAGREIIKEWEYSHRYRGWYVHWLSGVNAGTLSAFAGFDAKTLAFTLKEPLLMNEGDRFAYFPGQANWSIHHNTISGCTRPVVLDGYGSDTSLFTDNLIARGLATGVKEALVVKGNFTVTRNVFAGFDEPNSKALVVYPDPLGRSWADRCTGNLFRKCTQSKETKKGR